MARYDPRYNYPVGYGLGTAALGLADILGQGFDRYHRQSQDELGQQNQQQNYLLKLQELLAATQDRATARQDQQDALKRTLADKATEQAGSATALGLPDTVQEQTTESVPPAPQDLQDASGQLRPPTFLQTLGKARPLTLPEASSGFDPTQLTPNVIKILTERFGQKPKPQAPLGFGSSPLGIFNKDTGGVTTPVPQKADQPQIGQYDPTKEIGQVNPTDLSYRVIRPAIPAIEKPPAPSRERSLELQARAQLLKENKGVEPDPAAVAERTLKLDEASKIRVNTTEGQARQDLQDKKELLPAQRAGVVDQYGQPVRGSITQARIRDENLLVLRPPEAAAVAQVAQITTPFSKMLNAIEKGKLPKATGGSVYDTVQAYKNSITGTAQQFSDPDVAAFKAAQQNILFPLIRFEGGSSRQALVELQMRMKANPSLLDTDVSAAAQAEQIAEIVETRLKSVGLTASPDLQKELDRAHELAAGINARLSGGAGAAGSGGGDGATPAAKAFLQKILGR